jgi:alkylhydroperoxidase family enzyme
MMLLNYIFMGKLIFHFTQNRYHSFVLGLSEGLAVRCPTLELSGGSPRVAATRKVRPFHHDQLICEATLPKAWASSRLPCPLLEIGKAVGRDAEPTQTPEAITTVMHHPSIFRHQMALSVELNGCGTIPPRERELVVLRTTWLCRAPYAWGQHVENARHFGIATKEVERVTHGSSADGWSEHEAALLRAVEELLGDQSICDQIWDKLAQTWSDQQLIELPVLVGLYFTFAMQHNSIRVGLPQGNRGLHER